MLAMFQSNWKVREEWFRWCLDVPQVELDALRTGGLRSIMRTLFHIVDIEQYWIRCLVYGTEHHFDYAEYAELDEIRGLSKRMRPFVEEAVAAWTPERDQEIRTAAGEDGTAMELMYGDVLRYLIVHEAHHAGQLSVWAREIGLEPAAVAKLSGPAAFAQHRGIRR